MDNDWIKIADIASFIFLSAGFMLFIIWLIWRRGPYTLRNTPLRSNHLTLIEPFLIIGLWLAAGIISVTIAEHLHSEMPEWDLDFFKFVYMAIVEALISFGMFYLAARAFRNGLKGLGLSCNSIIRDFFSAIINYTAVLPLVFLGIRIVTVIGELVVGPGFKIEQSEGLEVITNISPLYKVIMFFCIVVIVPIFEETLFRGILQSALTRPWFSYIIRKSPSKLQLYRLMRKQSLPRQWYAIIISSVIFTMMHPSMHWPALFSLSLCMGYAYQKSGSLLRPIFIHAVFNGMNILGTLLIQST